MPKKYWIFLVNNKTQFPLTVLVPLGLVISFALLSFGFSLIGEPFVLVRLYDKFGFDFRDFQWASRYLLNGDMPWDWERFVTPPVSAVIMTPLSGTSPKKAINIFFVLNTLFVFGGLYFYSRSFPLGNRWRNVLFLMIISSFFSHPVFFLLQRGNIDGIVFFLLALGVFFSTRDEKWQNELAAGLAFAIAVHLKLYPVLIIFPVLMAGRWKLALFTVVFMALPFFLPHDLWLSFFEKILLRQDIYTMQENGSLINSISPLVFVSNYYTLQNALFFKFQTVILIGRTFAWSDEMIPCGHDNQATIC